MESITKRDREILRDLARRQLEYAKSPTMEKLAGEWKQHNDFQGGRPMIHLELWTFSQELIPQRLQCEGATARGIEAQLYGNFLNYEVFRDDKVVPDYFPMRWYAGMTLFGHEEKVTHATDSDGRDLGQHFEAIIHDLQEDLPKLGNSVWGVDRQGTQDRMDLLNSIFGDILPVRLGMDSLYAVPTQKVVHLMGMEAMMFSMYDYPDEFHQLMDRIAEDYLTYFNWLEQERLLLPTVGAETLNQGTLCYTDRLPNGSQGPLKTTDVWGFLDSQESVGMSPEMFQEFIFPCYRKIAEAYGLLSYGCCEPVDPVWEECISTLPNLRKVSISPWCNEEYMGEQLRGKNIVYLRKPSPNYLGVGDTLDEDGLRGHIQKTLHAAQGCSLELIQRDVYTVGHNEEKARRYVEILRECIESHWMP